MRRKNILFLIVAVLFLGGYVVNSATIPRKAIPVPFPFNDGECLKYEQIFYFQGASASTNEICFSKINNGFVEKRGDLMSTYDDKGFLRLTESDIVSWKKELRFDDKKKSKIETFLFNDTMSELDAHSIFYGPSDLRVGDLFYDNYSVVKFADYYGEPIYVVEHNTWTDVKISDKGVIGKSFWQFMRNYNRLLNRPTIRTGESDDLIEYFYYSRKTGILHGSERIWMKRDKSGNIILEDSSLKEKNSKTRLIVNL